MIGCYFGIILLSAQSLFSNSSSGQSTTYTIGILLSAISAFFIAVIFVATNKLKQVHYTIITFYLSITTAFVSLIMMFLQYAILDGRIPFEKLSAKIWLMLLAASILNYLGITFLTKSNQLGSPVTVAIILYI